MLLISITNKGCSYMTIIEFYNAMIMVRKKRHKHLLNGLLYYAEYLIALYHYYKQLVSMGIEPEIIPSFVFKKSTNNLKVLLFKTDKELNASEVLKRLKSNSRYYHPLLVYDRTSNYYALSLTRKIRKR